MPGRGHTVVLGTAGSGKTTMAIHHGYPPWPSTMAIHHGHPPRRDPGHPVTPFSGKVLLVTFNRTLLAYLRYWRPPELANVTFENNHTFARGYLASRGALERRWICGTNARRAELIAAAVTAVQKRRGDAPPSFFERPLRP